MIIVLGGTQCARIVNWNLTSEISILPVLISKWDDVTVV